MRNQRSDLERRDRFDRSLRLVKIGVLIVGVACVGSIFWGARQNSKRVDEINAQRARVLRESCESQNDRHDDTIIALDQQLLLSLGIKPVRPSPLLPKDVTISLLDRQVAQTPAIVPKRLRARAAQVTQTRAFTGLLIDALVPVRDCDAVVRRGVGR